MVRAARVAPALADWIDAQVVALAGQRDAAVGDLATLMARARSSAQAELPPEQVAAAMAALERRLWALARAERALRMPDGTDLGLADFEVQALLGRGGYGRVYRARQRSLGRMVALKLPLVPFADAGRETERLRREALALARLDHPGIVKVFQVLEHDRTPVLVMELVDGVALDEVLAALPAQPLAARLQEPGLAHDQAACRLLLEVLRAVGHAHGQGIVHRDLKPGNVMLDRTGRVRVLDFGLAHADGAASLTHTAALIGTPQYLAPELLADPRRTGIATDVYALGVLLYQLLALRPPFGDGSREVTLARIRAGDSAPLRHDSPELCAVVARAMAPEPGQRYPDCAAFAADLERWTNGEPVLAKPTPWTLRVRRRLRRRPELGVAMLAALAALLVFAVVWFRDQSRRARHERVTGAALDQAAEALDRGRLLRAAELLASARPLLADPDTSAAARERGADLERMVTAASTLEELRAVALTSAAATRRELTERYQATLSSLGVSFTAPADATAAAVRGHPLREQIVRALDDWSRGAGAVPGLAAVAAAADPDPLRVRVRTACAAGDLAALRAIAGADDLLTASAPTLLLLAHGLSERGDPAAADRVLRLGPVLHPEDVWLLLALARALGRSPHEADQRAAAQCLRSAVALRPQDVDLLAATAMALARIPEAELAVRTARQAVARDGGNPGAWVALGAALRAAGETQAAIEAVRTGLAVAPGGAAGMLHHRLGVLLQDAGQGAEAVAALQRAVALLDQPEAMAQARIALAFVVLDHLGDFARATGLLREAMAVHPGSAEAAFLLATVQVRHGEHAAALEVMEAALARDPRFLDGDHTRLHFMAVLLLEDARELPPSDPRATRQRGRALAWLSRSLAEVLRVTAADPARAKGSWLWLRDWRTCEPLVRLRREVVLAELPAEEASSWRTLWLRHDAVLAGLRAEQDR